LLCSTGVLLVCLCHLQHDPPHMHYNYQ
jgi:hypothetical protein